MVPWGYHEGAYTLHCHTAVSSLTYCRVYVARPAPHHTLVPTVLLVQEGENDRFVVLYDDGDTEYDVRREFIRHQC